MKKSQLNDYCSKWELSEVEKISDTFTSSIYKAKYRNDDVVLTILSKAGVIDEKNGAITLQHFDGKRAAKIILHDESAHLLEFVGGGSLRALVESGNDNQATEIICETLGEIHNSGETYDTNNN